MPWIPHLPHRPSSFILCLNPRQTTYHPTTHHPVAALLWPITLPIFRQSQPSYQYQLVTTLPQESPLSPYPGTQMGSSLATPTGWENQQPQHKPQAQPPLQPNHPKMAESNQVWQPLHLAPPPKNRRPLATRQGFSPMAYLPLVAVQLPLGSSVPGSVAPSSRLLL